MLGRWCVDIGVHHRLLRVILLLLVNKWLAWLVHLGLTTINDGLAVHVVHTGVHWNALSWHSIKRGWHRLAILPQTGHFTHLLQLRHALHVFRWSSPHSNQISTHHHHLGLSGAWVLHHDHLMLTTDHLSLASVRLILSSDRLVGLNVLTLDDGRLAL